MALTASAEEKQGTRRTIIMILVILVHVVALWGLQNGLARRLVEILPNDIKAELIKDEKKEEPPPPPPPPPDQQTPPPPFVPPVEVAIAVPMAVPTTITTTNEKPPVTAAPIMAPKQVVIGPRVDMKKSLGSCNELYNESSALKRDSAEGSVVVRCTIAANGRCNDPTVGQSSGIDALDQLGTKCAKDLLRFIPGKVDGVVQTQVYEFKLTFKPENGR